MKEQRAQFHDVDSYNSDARVEICRRINTSSQRCCAKCWHDVVPANTVLMVSPPLLLCRYHPKSNGTAFNMLIKMSAVIKDLLVVSMVLGFLSRFVSADDECDTTGVEVSCTRDNLTKVPTFLNQDVTSM